MPIQNEVNEILETIRKELPSRAHDAYEEAVKRALRERRKHRHGRGFDWSALERSLPFTVQSKHEQHQEGLMPMLTLLIGFIGGAALMYLFDPDRGARRRAAIQVEVRKVANEATEVVEETVERVRSEVGKVADEGEDKIEQLGDQAKAAADTAATSVRNSAAQVSSQVEDAANQAKNTASKAGDALGDAAQQAKSTAGKIGDKAEDAVDDAAKKARSAADDLKKTAGNTTE